MADVLDIDDPNAKDYGEAGIDEDINAVVVSGEVAIDQDDNVITTRTVTVIGGSNSTAAEAGDNSSDGPVVGDAQAAVRELKERAIKKKGRGFRDRENAVAAAATSKSGSIVRAYDDDNDYEMGNVDDISSGGDDLMPVKSIEGWVIFVSGLHEETQEDVMMDKFSEFGSVRNMHMNPDRRTGFIKGYAIIEFDSYDEAALAIKTMDGQTMYGKQLRVTWAFAKPEHVRRRR